MVKFQKFDLSFVRCFFEATLHTDGRPASPFLFEVSSRVGVSVNRTMILLILKGNDIF